MNLLIISRDKIKLSEQQSELIALGSTKNISVKFLVYDFTNMDQIVRKEFYEVVDKECIEMVSLIDERRVMPCLRHIYSLD